jgi:hypothetical protein
MTKYGSYSGSTGSNDGNYDDITLKLQKFSSIRVEGDRVNAFNGNYGDKFIAGFQNVAVTDGIVFQRNDKEDTWKVFGFGELGFTMLEDGRIVHLKGRDPDEVDIGDDDGLSAAEILAHPEVQGFSEKFGDDKYWYTPVGVAIEGDEDTDGVEDSAVNDDLDVTMADDGAIEVGEVSMLLSNKSWVRKLAKFLTEQGDEMVEQVPRTNDDGDKIYDDEGNVEMKDSTDDYGWLTTHEPDMRDQLDGREMELFVIEESWTPDDSDEEITFTTPILLDAKTGERIGHDNDASDGDADESAADADSGTQQATATDGGSATQDTTTESDTTSTDSPDATDTADGGDDGDELPDDVPGVLEEVIDYYSRTDGEDTTADEMREFASSDVDDPDAVDWEAAAEEARSRVE